MSKKGTQIITQIKGDNQQNLKTKELNFKKLEDVLVQAKEQVPLVPQEYQKHNQLITEKSNHLDNTIKFERGIADFHIHAVLANRNDQVLFRKHLVSIHRDLMRRNEEYREEIQQLRFQQQEMENDLKSKIEAVVHQLKGLRPFQERRKIIIEQKKALEDLISKEKQKHQDELTDIHHQLLDQREYYENDLKTRLEMAHKYAKQFADLHIDVLTKKIAEETTSKRKELYNIEDRFLKELYDVDSLVKTSNFFTNRNQTLRKNIENTTFQIIRFKEEKKDVEIEMLQKMAAHEEEISKLKDNLTEKENDVINVRMAKLREENDRLKREASEAFELMKKAENSRTNGEKSDTFLGPTKDRSFEIDLLKKMKDVADLVIQAIEDKFGASDDPIFLSQKTAMGKLIRRLTLIENEIKKPLVSSMNHEDSSEMINFNYGYEMSSDLAMNVDLDDLDNSNHVSYTDNLNDINQNELTDSNSHSSGQSDSQNFNQSDSQNFNKSDSQNFNQSDSQNFNQSYSNFNEEENTETTEKTNEGDGNVETLIISSGDSANEEGFNYENDGNVDTLIIGSSTSGSVSVNINETYPKVSVEVQTDKPIRSDKLKGIRVPPTTPNYPYEHRESLSKTLKLRSNFSKDQNKGRNTLNYLYYTYANKHAPEEESAELDDSRFEHLNQPVKLNGEIFTPKPPEIPVTGSAKVRMNLKNETFKDATIDLGKLNDRKTASNKYESSYFSRSLTPRRRIIKRHEYSVTSDFKKISNSGRMPSAYIRIIREPK